jgi:hypothetical protein
VSCVVARCLNGSWSPLSTACGTCVSTSEGEEGGRRQAEMNLRAKQDVVYKQLHRVHSQTAETFVDGLLATSVERCASESALIETRMRGALVGPVIDRLELRNGVGVAVKDLVASFLLPEVERRQVQAQGSCESRV